MEAIFSCTPVFLERQQRASPSGRNLTSLGLPSLPPLCPCSCSETRQEQVRKCSLTDGEAVQTGTVTSPRSQGDLGEELETECSLWIPGLTPPARRPPARKFSRDFRPCSAKPTQGRAGSCAPAAAVLQLPPAPRDLARGPGSAKTGRGDAVLVRRRLLPACCEAQPGDKRVRKNPFPQSGGEQNRRVTFFCPARAKQPEHSEKAAAHTESPFPAVTGVSCWAPFTSKDTAASAIQAASAH